VQAVSSFQLNRVFWIFFIWDLSQSEDRGKGKKKSVHSLEVSKVNLKTAGKNQFLNSRKKAWFIFINQDKNISLLLA